MGLPAGAVQDADGNVSAVSNKATVAWDATAPGVTVTPAAGQGTTTNTSPIVFTVTFTEPVTGFDATDIDTSASTAGGTWSPTSPTTGTAPSTPCR